MMWRRVLTTVCMACAWTIAWSSSFEELESLISAKQGFVLTQEEGLEVWTATQFAFEIVDIGVDQENVEKAVKDVLQTCGLEILDGSETFEPLSAGGEQVAFAFWERGHLRVVYNENKSIASLDVFLSRDKEDLATKLAAVFAVTCKGSVATSYRFARGIPNPTTLNELLLSPAAIVEEQERLVGDPEAVKQALEAPLGERWANELSERDFSLIFADLDEEYEVIHQERTKYQFIEFLKNPTTKDVCLFLDNVIQICKSFDAAYSEVYTHLPAAFLPKLERVLIVGGGDALALREVLEYSSVKRVVQLELDRRVPELCERFFELNAHLPGSKAADPRVEWVFGDASKTIEDLISKQERFDLILMDISETGASTSVSSLNFFRYVSRVLEPHGIFIKNDPNYQRSTALLFNEFLEISYPVPVIAEQTFVLGSNGTSLLPPPSFAVFDENKINTTYLAHGPSTNFRQLQGMVRRYESRSVFEEASSITRSDGGVLQDDWKCGRKQGRFGLPLQITIVNMSPLPVSLWYVPIGSKDIIDRDLIFEFLQPNDTRDVTVTEFDDLIIADAEKLDVDLATFQVCKQHRTHPRVVYLGLQQPLLASPPL